MSTRYNVGDRVVIVSERTNSMNDEGKMDKYLGTVMTIREVGNTGNSFLPYSMVEDAEDYFYNNHKGWIWGDEMINHEATARLHNGEIAKSEPEPEIANEFSVDYYTDKVYNMLDKFSRDGDLLENADNYSKDGIRKNVTEWLTNKSKLINILRKHPLWNEEAKAVVYLNTEHRMPSYEDSKKAFDNLTANCGYDSYTAENDYPWLDVRKFFETMSLEDWKTMIEESDINDYEYVPKNSINGMALFISIFKTIFHCNPMNTISERVANCINRIFPDMRVHTGQKSSRVVNKLLCKFNFDKSPNYNREFAKLADSMNPFDVKRISVLSVNIIDFLLMSNGNSWSSCHTIVNNSGSNYGGCYMGGTLSYANDGESMIFYTLDSSYEGTDWCFEPKINRQVFFWDYPVLVQERLYPQCNDNTEQGKELVKQYRTIVEDIFATCLEAPNLWVKENRNRASIDNRRNTFMYEDWEHFPNYIVHLKKETAVSESEVEECDDSDVRDSEYVVRSAKHIAVGGASYCINCGATKRWDDFSDEDNAHNGLLCHECHPQEEYCRCENCGYRSNREDMHYIDEEYYCSDCCFYCEYHEEYEIGDSHYVNNYGDVCEDACYNSGEFEYCNDCEEWYCCGDLNTAHDRYDDEVSVCNYCLENNYTQCDDCGEYFSDRTITVINDHSYCERCAEDHANDEEETA